MDPHWLEIQRRFGWLSSIRTVDATRQPWWPSPPGVYPPTSLASDLMQRERERLERLDILQNDQMTGRMIYQIYSQRLTNEQIYLQRVTNECILQTKHERSLLDPASHLVYQFSRADPLGGGLPGSSTPVSLPSPLVHGLPPHAGLLSNREQEMLQSDLYRRAYDPAFAHQLSAQAAQHEAIQRQIALERERYGPLPPH
ncbi:RERE [Mytilus coruscus]|uniref:RERE n=1 Tax=Mytilus coruscus TaxID=42192 RepID=A0A6J7ZYI5_MYTCO|nr:RERE [Mytilus coruscus]